MKNVTRAVLMLTLLALAHGARAADEQEPSALDALLTQAAEETTAGRYTKAAELYGEAVRLWPNDPQPRLLLIDLLAQVEGKESQCRRAIDDALEAGVFSDEQLEQVAGVCTDWGFEAEAMRLFHMLIEKHPDNPEFMAKALELMIAGDAKAERVIGEIEKLIGATPEPAVARRIATMCERVLRYDEAAWVYGTLLEADEKDLDARLAMARIKLKTGKFDEAEKLVEANRAIDPEHVETRLLLSELKLRRGEYVEALEEFRTVSKTEGGFYDAYLGEARAALAIGRYDDAISAALKAIKLDAEAAPAHALLGELYAATGRYSRAEDEYGAALEADEANVEAIIGAALSLRAAGKHDEAERTFYRLYDLYEAATTERELTARMLTHVGVACRYTDNPKDALHCFVEATKKDSTYIPARLWLGELFLERHQKNDAVKEFADILKIDPHHTGALVGLAKAAMEDGQFGDAQQRCDEALAVNPNLVDALNILAWLNILDEQYALARETLDRSLAVNPKSLETLATLAAWHHQSGDARSFERTMEQILAINPRYAEGYEIVAAACEYRRQNGEALALLYKALELDPRAASAWTSLGGILMREGLEEEAGEALSTAFRLDSYNHRTLNFKKVLDELKADYAVRETEHFVLKWHDERDFALRHFLPEFVEDAYARVCGQFGFEPPAKTLIEVFPDHDRFAARISGMPFIATVGACFGKVFAMDSPRHSGFNWQQVFEHEFVHVVTLQQTNMNIPMWFTEGLAVSWETGPTPIEWDRMAVRCAVLEEVVPLDELNSWFTRARSMGQRQWAYAQSLLIAEYLYAEYGRETIVKMLELYRDGVKTADVIQKACGIDQAEFERRTRASIIGRGRALRVPPLFILDDAERLKARLDAEPENAALHARYAQAIAQRTAAARGPAPSDLIDEARTHAEKAIELGSAMPEPYTVLAFLEANAGNEAAATTRCNEALAKDPGNYSAHRTLADIAAKAGRLDEALTHYEAAKRTYPRDSAVSHALAGIYSKRKEDDKAIAELEHVLQVDRQPYRALLQLGELYAQRKAWKDAVRVLEKALEFNLYDPDVYASLVRAYTEREQDDKAEEFRALGARIALGAAKTTFKRAEVIHYLLIALALDPTSEEARSLAAQAGIDPDNPPTEAEQPVPPSEDGRPADAEGAGY
ncbi:MAG: tetratricopeptide repeat protein [Verrucomicrobia bacterium]|nr:tetratricopeptide repeat protein [Verrucomicrobiota bacterium]